MGALADRTLQRISDALSVVPFSEHLEVVFDTLKEAGYECFPRCLKCGELLPEELNRGDLHVRCG